RSSALTARQVPGGGEGNAAQRALRIAVENLPPRRFQQGRGRFQIRPVDRAIVVRRGRALVPVVPVVAAWLPTVQVIAEQYDALDAEQHRQIDGVVPTVAAADGVRIERQPRLAL